MAFRVEPSALRQYETQLSDAVEATHAGRAYITKHGELTWHEAGMARYAWPDSLIHLFHPAHDRFVDEMASTLSHLGDLLDGCELALKATASWYNETDRRSASRLDSTYPQVDRPSPDPEG